MGQCRKMINFDKAKKCEKALILCEVPAFAYHSNLSLVRCLTTVVPLRFHFKNWLTFVQQQNQHERNRKIKSSMLKDSGKPYAYPYIAQNYFIISIPLWSESAEIAPVA